MKPLQFFIQMFYAVVLFSAAGETEGLLSGACIAGGILTIVSLAALLIAWSITAAVKEKKRK